MIKKRQKKGGRQKAHNTPLKISSTLKRTREGEGGGGAVASRGGGGFAVSGGPGGGGGGHKRRNNAEGTGESSGGSHSGSGDRDDEVGHCSLRVGDVFNGYRYVSEGGKGTFGLVLLCEELRTRRMVAVKVVRKIRKYTESARMEASVLEDLALADPQGASQCVEYLSSFEWRGHFCMVFEPLGKSLYDLVKANKFQPLSLSFIQSCAEQLVAAVVFLHRMRLIHTDLKLENILLSTSEPFEWREKTTRRRTAGEVVVVPRDYSIKLIDFGGATYDYCRKAGLICTRQYRAPEVILGMEWSLPSDVWSLGCILAELYNGQLLFETVRGLGGWLEGASSLNPCPPPLPLFFYSHNTHFSHKHTHSLSRHSMTMGSTWP